MDRRQFIKLTAATAASGLISGRPSTDAATEGSPLNRTPDNLTAFNYSGVRLTEGPMLDRLIATRNYYLAIPDDDILKGFRRKSGFDAPGVDMGGWCNDTCAVTFGQWISGMARMSAAMNDGELRDKAILLITEWGKTMPFIQLGHYDYDKYVVGLLDLAEYCSYPEALPLLAKLTDRAEKELKRDRLNATNDDSQGGYFNGQEEWYTLPENLYRAYQFTRDERFRSFAAVWLYPNYWNMFLTDNPRPDGFHAYSHVNTLSSAAMAYVVTGESHYLKTIVNAYDYFQNTQCYVTGGYGPGEKLMAPDGSLGDSIVTEPNAKYLGGIAGRSFETPCGTWAVFKLTRYLQTITGEARFGDWSERLLYNGIGAALPMSGRGKTFYYADYRQTGGRKYYFGSAWPCCSGTYLQNVADYHNIIYYKSAAGLTVNMYVPSTAEWQQNGQTVTVTQSTGYPNSSRSDLSLSMAKPVDFTVSVRVPAWASDVTLVLNGKPVDATIVPGKWASIKRRWKNGDTLAINIPLVDRAVAIDVQHPQRVAYARGPMALVLPESAAPDAPNTPFAATTEGASYQMYFDR